jgi:hypothetical protein
LTLGATANISTLGKYTVSGDTPIVIEARMAGLGGARDTAISLVDVASGAAADSLANSIQFGDTSYSGWGFRMNGFGVFNFVEVERPSGVGPAPQNVTTLGSSTNTYMEYRLTVSGTQIKMERGPTLANITQTATRTLSQSIAGKSFYLRLSTGGAFSPATYDWVRVTTPLVWEVPVATSTIDLPATAFVRGVSVALSANGYGADAVMNAPPYGAADNSAEWDFAVPVAGRYELFATYASGESRPVMISFDANLVFSNALATSTGGYFPANRQTLSQGFVDLAAGSHVMRVAETGANVFPHIKGFTLVPVLGNTLAAFNDTFETASLDTNLWASAIGYGLGAVAGGLLDLGPGTGVSTLGKRLFSGSKINITTSIKVAGGGVYDTYVVLFDAATNEVIAVGEHPSPIGTTGPLGLYAYGGGGYAFTGTNRTPASGTGVSYEFTGVITTQFKVLNIQVDGSTLTVQRGDQSAGGNVTYSESFTRSLGRSIVGRQFYMLIANHGSGAQNAKVDWIKVATQ